MNNPRLPSYKKKKLSVRTALLSIFLSIFLVTGIPVVFFVFYQQKLEKQKNDPAHQIVAVVQTSPESQALKTGYLTELLGLSVDRPFNLYDYDVEEAERKLRNLPLIKQVTVQKVRPNIIHVDYTLRKPIAYIADFTNTAVDAEGMVFPFRPFYTPKKLPEIYIGLADEKLNPYWGTILSGDGKELAFKIVELAPQYCDAYSTLCAVDVSRAFASSDGQREIVILIEDRQIGMHEGKTILRVNTHKLHLRQDNLREQLGNYVVLRKYLREQGKKEFLSDEGMNCKAKTIEIDLRLSELAFISERALLHK